MVQEDSLSQRQINSAKKIIKQVAMLNSPSSMEVNVKESSVKEVEPQPPNIDNNRSISPKGPPDKKLSNNKRNKKSFEAALLCYVGDVVQIGGLFALLVVVEVWCRFKPALSWLFAQFGAHQFGAGFWMC
ncbi:hypothetical protein U1Q18_009002 [Sarracenia purpurea var. burkii]